MIQLGSFDKIVTLADREAYLRQTAAISGATGNEAIHTADGGGSGAVIVGLDCGRAQEGERAAGLMPRAFCVAGFIGSLKPRSGPFL